MFCPFCHPKAYRDKSRGRLACSASFLCSKQLLPFYLGTGWVFGFLGYLPLCAWLSSLPHSPSAVSQIEKTEKHSAGPGIFPELFSIHASFLAGTFLHLILFKSHPFFKAPNISPWSPHLKGFFFFEFTVCSSPLAFITFRWNKHPAGKHSYRWTYCWLLASIRLGGCLFWLALGHVLLVFVLFHFCIFNSTSAFCPRL